MSRGDVRIVNTKNVREEAIKGARVVYEAVSAAYGPTSGNVALEKTYGSYVISHDGVSIAKDIVLKDKHQDIGADLLIQASKKSNDISGDGTTCSILLGYHIMDRANQAIAAGFNPMAIRRGINRASEDIKTQLDMLATPVKDSELANVAAISAGDPEVGKLVADTVLKVGGVGITIEEYQGLGVIQDVVEGLYFEKGWALEHFVTDKQTEEVVMDNPTIIAIEKRLSANQDVVPIMEKVFAETESKSIIFIANISGQALETCALTNIAGKVKVCVVNPPAFGDQMLPFLEDIATLTGGKVVPSQLPSDQVTSDYFGEADRVVVGRVDTTILGGKGVKEDIQLRTQQLKEQMKSDKYSPFQKERMEMRLAKLQGKIGIIRVGGATESEVKEMKFRVEDAVQATRAAREEGIVAGGATTLVKLWANNLLPDLDKDEMQGYLAVKEACYEPFKQLIANAGDDGHYRLKQLQAAEYGKGFDVKNMTDEPIDIFKAGVTDPTKVLKSIVENACSVAGIAITLNGSVLIDRDFQLEQVQLTKQGING